MFNFVCFYLFLFLIYFFTENESNMQGLWRTGSRFSFWCIYVRGMQGKYEQITITSFFFFCNLTFERKKNLKNFLILFVEYLQSYIRPIDLIFVHYYSYGVTNSTVNH